MKFKFFGTKIFISFPFAAIICFMLYADKTGLALHSLLAVFLHEAGHLIAMKLSNCAPKEIRLIPASVQIVKGFCTSNSNEFLIALSGPFSNILIGGCFYFLYQSAASDLCGIFAAVNFLFAIFNLLPSSGLDGGTVIRLIFSVKDPACGEAVLKITTAVLSAAAFFTGIYFWSAGNFNPTFFALTLYFALCIFIKV